MSPQFSEADDVYEFMESHMVKWNFRGEMQEFLPKPAFAAVTTKEVIELVVSDDANFLLDVQAQEHFVMKVHEEAPIMFTTCFYAAGLSMAVLKALLDSGLNDQDLPLTKDSCANTKLKRLIPTFCDNQKRFRIAYFGLNSMQNLGDITKPIKFDEDEKHLLGTGAFGEVWEIEIHDDHRSFFNVRTFYRILCNCTKFGGKGAGAKNKFAMKVTQQAGREPQFHIAMADLTHSHLLKCLASFTFSSKYHMIYEKADQDLEKFIGENKNVSDITSFSGSDLARQLYGLAGALSVIHNQENVGSDYNASLLGVPRERFSRAGYIHDIKPDNILVFIYNQDGKKTYWMRLSDFSCANVRDLVRSVSGQKRDSWATENKKSTPNYRAPEFLRDEKISRPYDMWSLGCVYLELLVWYTEGYDALKEFRTARLRQVKPDGIKDEGFCYTTERGENATVHLRDIVQKKLKEVSVRCTGHLAAIAKVVPGLLQVDPKKRPTAADLVEQLKHLDNGERPPFDYEQPNSLGLPSMAAPQVPTYESDSDCSSFDGLVMVTGATQ
ncbi:positive regulation of MDA-5 signaling pathway [Neocucurbitaria cava]|uniref:Positive regulation of MDA-5 signaling pathway n=1 Tax=Neocucurbitaria cava TaxID=798079 RepID=A0A9W8Y2S1_9PLEO|nr:positive regulation of MDA-5 signaling pathway [Neocucurbitaria cava]